LSEVLVTTALASVTALLAFGIYARGSLASRTQARSVTLEQRLRAAQEVLAHDVRQAGYLEPEGPPVERDAEGVFRVRYGEVSTYRPGDPGVAVDHEDRTCSFDREPRTECPELAWEAGRVRLARRVMRSYRLREGVLEMATGEDFTPLAEDISELLIEIRGGLVRVTLSGRDGGLERSVTTFVRLRNAPR
jgi:type II secretory pathway component PulJ